MHGATDFSDFQLFLRTDLGINLADPSRSDLACPPPSTETLFMNSYGEWTYSSKCEDISPGESGSNDESQNILGFLFMYVSV